MSPFCNHSTRRLPSASATVVALLAAVMLLVAPRSRAEAEPQDIPAEGVAERFVELALYPPTVELHHAEAYQRMVVVATRDDGVTLDVTDKATWRLEEVGGGETQVAAIEGGTVRPQVAGRATLKVKWHQLVAQADIHVADATQRLPVSYRHDVIPVLTRTGCNSGACHGSSRGKDGFGLSLFGFDPASDYQRLTRELATRRVNLAIPDDSLLLQKATAAVPHTGGKRFEPDSEYYKKLRDWIEHGVSDDLAQAPTVDRLEIFPPRAVLEGSDASQQFTAVAHYSDGKSRDVTSLALFSSNNDSTAAIDDRGRVTAGLRGEAFVMARFDTHTVGSQVLVLPADAKYEKPTEQPVNYVDELIGKKLATLRVEPSGLASDEEFLRRVTIDITGTLPTRSEVEAFREDSDPEKRARKIDELLGRKEFSRVWALKWAELLMVRTVTNRVDYKPMFLYSKWLEEQIDNEVPLDTMVRNLLSASGSSFTTPQVNFYQVEPESLKIAENVAQAFLGIRMQCAQCHNHPFDRWTMDDYYGFAAFFSQVGRKTGEDYREVIVFDRNGGDVKHPVDGRSMKPKFLGEEEPEFEGRPYREVLAEWVTSPENPYFATNIANRVWAHYMGSGIIEPVDDVRISNPPSNPELLEALGKKLMEYDYDLRQLVRDICNSNAYQRSTVATESNATDTRNYARALPRRLPAEALLDCICQVTESPEKLPGLPLGSRAVEIADGNSSTYFLTTFGRATRETVCACEVKHEPTLSQALHLLNGATVHGKIEQGKVVERLLKEGMTPHEVVDEIYVRSLGRKPTQAEREKIEQVLGSGEAPVGELNDLFWAVLNSREFLFNH